MARNPRTGSRSVDADGVLEERTAPPSRVEAASGIVLALAAAGMVWLALSPSGGAPPAPSPPPSPPPATPPATIEPARPLAPSGAALTPAATPAVTLPARTPAVTPPDLAPGPQPGAPPEAAPPPAGDALAPAPDRPGPTGLAVFPPLGTKPVLRGVVVPEGFELPPGYVRHFQTTDDGRMLAPVLLYHPDHAPPGADGQPRVAAEDRVVPAEQVPPGMPVEVLDPPPAEPRP